MQKKMGHCFFTRVAMYTRLIFTYLESIFLFYILDFKSYLLNAKKIRISSKANAIDSDKIYMFERKISRKLRMKKCLISAHFLHKSFKKLGYESTLHIGFDLKQDKESHAWVSVKGKKYLLSRDDKVDETLKII